MVGYGEVEIIDTWKCTHHTNKSYVAVITKPIYHFDEVGDLLIVQNDNPSETFYRCGPCCSREEI